MSGTRLESRHSFLPGNLPGIESSGIVELWALRALVRLNGWSVIQGEDKQLLRQQLEQVLLLDSSIRDTFSIAGQAARKLELLESCPPEVPEDLLLIQNLRLLAQTIALSEAEVDLFFLTVVAKNVTWLGDLLDAFGELRPAGLYRILTACLDISESQAQQILDVSTPLGRSGLINVSDGPERFTSKLTMPLGVMDKLLCKIEFPIDLLGANVRCSAPPKLDADSYPHLATDIQIISGLLSSVIHLKDKGANVLIYGPPGTGKTEFVRMLAMAVGVTLLEIGTVNGVVDTWRNRLRYFEMAQAVLSKAPTTVFLFDEVEDVFATVGEDPGKPNQSGQKARIARLLEENPIPSFWITNHIRSIDPAFRRRFDYVLEMKVPPRSVRISILDRYLDDLKIGKEMLEALAENENMPPAVVERAALVIRRLSNQSSSGGNEMMLARVIDNSLGCLGLRKSPIPTHDNTLAYDLRFIHADIAPEELIAGLRTAGSGRLCLYGPPGTGKTAFAKAIALSLDLPLMVKRASDILSPWVGGTEENIARMFEQAREEGALLLLDEADSFLQDRQGAVRGWEITQVNEMLTQIETYEGIFVASTNLMDTLDPAALRRFDLKARFGYMTADQADQMVNDVARRLGLESGTAMPSNLSNVTPGDFAAVVRQARFRPITSAFELYRRLKAECEMKPGSCRNAIGFAA